MLATRHGKPHTEEENTKLRGFHASDKIIQLFAGQSGFGDLLVRDDFVFDHRTQHRDQLKILAGFDLQEDIGSFDAFGFANINQHHGAVFSTAGQEPALLHQRVFGEMSWMALRRVASPVDNEISPILDFAERACDFASQLGGDFCGTVSQRRMAVQQGPKIVSDINTFLLRFTSRVAHPVHQWHIRVIEIFRRSFNRFVNGGFLAVDDRIRILFLRRMIEKPSLAEHTGALGLVDPRFISVQLDVVADATAEGAGRVIDDLQIRAHGVFLVAWVLLRWWLTDRHMRDRRLDACLRWCHPNRTTER